MNTADHKDFCRECDHEISTNAVKCENCKKAVLSFESWQTEELIIKQEPETDLDTTTDYNSAAEDLQTDTIRSLLPAQVKSDVSELLNNEMLERCDEAQTQQSTTRAEKTCDTKLYECDNCGKTFKRVSLLKTHRLRSHTTTECDEDETFSKIPAKTQNKKERRSHKYQQALKLKSHSDFDDDTVTSAEDSDTSLIDVESMPTDLNALYDSLTKLKKTPIGKNVYKCRMCQKITLDLRDHRKHIITHTGQEWNTCVLCEDVFLGADSLDDHIAKAHPNLNEPKVDEYLPSGIIKCKECSECFVSASEFERHKRWHAGQKTQHNCNICQTGFTTPAVLQKHKRTIHNNNKNLPKRFKCFLCKEGFAFQILLTNHKRSHPEFFELIERTTIMHRYKNSNKILYACRTCGKSTHKQTTHLEHLRIHSSERPMYKCPLCSKQFTAQSTLKAHIRLHTDERQYKCEICEISFRHRRSLRLHLIKHTGERPIKCKYCDQSFMVRNLCTEHVRRMHTGETPYQCEICGEWFTTAGQVPMHKMQKHNVNTRVKRTVDIIVDKSLEKSES